MIYWHHKIDNKEFENLICDLFNADRKTVSFETYGRSGQRQYGVDVFSEEYATLIQCKYKENLDKSKLKETLKEEIKEELKKTFDKKAVWYNEIGKFNHFIFASTFYHDTELQNFALNLKDDNGNKYPVTISYLGREEIIKLICKHEDVMIKYFRNVFEQLLPQQKNLNTVPKYDYINLIGRTQEINTIHNNLIDKSLLLSTGIGGIGKTTIALALVNNAFYTDAYDKIAWVTVKQDFIQDFVSQLSGLFAPNFDYSQDYTNAFSLLIKLLGKKKIGLKNNLLIIDNWNNHSEIQLNYQKLIDSQWKILITSRANFDFNNYIEIEHLSQSEAISLFKCYYPDIDNENALIELLDTIEYHTLLIELISKVGYKRGKSISELLKIIKEKSFAASELQRNIAIGLHSEFANKGKDARILEYMKSIFELEILSKYERRILMYLAILPPQTELQTLKELFSIENDDELEFEEDLDELHKKGWINIKASNVYQHSIIQKVILEKLKPTSKKTIVVIVNLWKMMQWSDTENTYSKTKYLPYAESVLSKIDDNHLDLGVIARRCSIIYNDIRKPDKAIIYGKRLVEIEEANADDYKYGLMTAYKNLSLFYSDLNDDENFLTYNDKYINTAKEYLEFQKEEESKFGLKLYKELDEADIFEGIAAYYSSKSEYKKELNFLLKSLAIRRQNIGDEMNSLILLYGNIASTYEQLEKNEEAEKCHKQAVDYVTQYLPSNHRYSITVHNNYSVILGKLGKWENSLNYAKQAFQDNQSNFEDITHPTFGELSFNVALAHLMLGKKQLAKENIENTIKCWEKLPNEHPNMEDAKTFYQDMINRLPSTSSLSKIGRNELCPCGSRLKYKKCCGK